MDKKIIAIAVLSFLLVFAVIVIIGLVGMYDELKSKYEHALLEVEKWRKYAEYLENKLHEIDVNLTKLEELTNVLKKNVEELVNNVNARVTSTDAVVFANRLEKLLTIDDFELAYSKLQQVVKQFKISLSNVEDVVKSVFYYTSTLAICSDPRITTVNYSIVKLFIHGHLIEIPLVKSITRNDFIRTPRELLNNVFQCGDCEDVALLTYAMLYTYFKWYRHDSHRYRVYFAYWIDYDLNTAHAFVIVHDYCRNEIIVIDPGLKYVTYTFAECVDGLMSYLEYLKLRNFNPDTFSVIEIDVDVKSGEVRSEVVLNKVDFVKLVVTLCKGYLSN